MQVFLSMLVKVTCLDLPLWHRILVLEILRVIFKVLIVTYLYPYNLWIVDDLLVLIKDIENYIYCLISQGFCVEARTLRTLFHNFDM